MTALPDPFQLSCSKEECRINVEKLSFASVHSGRGRTLNFVPGADKSLARPGRKQVWKYVREARDFNNIETRAVIKFFFPARQGAEGNSRHSYRNISFFVSWSG
jgi:hypothetical protein